MARTHLWMERLSRAADLQEEPIPGLPLIELAGDRRVLIENHCGVTEYGPDRICVKVKFGKVSVCGQNMELAKMTRGQLVVTGTINSVELMRGCR